MLEHPASEPESLLLDRYRLLRQVASGGAGSVWEALDEGLGRKIAVKLCSDRSPGGEERFAREFRWLSGLHHPAIIRARDYAVDARGPFYTMELLDGRDLGELAPLDVESVCRHLRDLASALALLHARGLVYRDLSARNVRVTSAGRAKLLDFGALAEGGVQETIIATPPYTAPECLEGADLDERSDLYALGALGYYLLTKQHAYPARTLRELFDHWEQEPPPPSAFTPWVPAALDELILSLLNLDARARPSCAAAVIDRLNAITNLAPERSLDVARSYFQAPVLVGRETEVGVVRRALHHAHEGNGGTIHFEADAGLGKSRLLHELRVEAQLTGATVISIEGARGSRIQLDAELGRALGVVCPRPRPERGRTDDLMQSVLELSRTRTLVLLVDDLHLLEQGSMGLLSALTLAAEDTRLLLVTSRRSDAPASPILDRALSAGERLRLCALSRAHTHALIAMLFHGAPHLERWSSALHDATGGNPLHLISLGVELMRSDVARYEDGAWTLQPQPQLPPGTDLWASLGARLRRLSPAARSLAEALSVFSDPPTFELCERVWRVKDRDALQRALGELEAEGVVVSHAGEVRFAQTSVRECLYRDLSDERARELHGRAATALLELKQSSPSQEVEIGWHLLRSGEQERGARLLEQAAVTLAIQGKQLPIAVPALEAALRVYRQRKSAPERQQRLITTLLASAYAYGPELVTRYAEEALLGIRRLSGMPTARRASRFVGSRLGLLLGVAHAFLRRMLTPRLRRAYTRKEGIAGAWGSWATCMAVGATTLDLELQERTLEEISLFGAFSPRNALGLMFRHCRSGYWVARGMEGRACEDWNAVLGPLGRKGGVRGLPEDVRTQFLAVVLGGLGQASVLACSNDAPEYAARIRKLEMEHVQPLAWYLDLIHFAFRGEIDRAEGARRGLEMSNACLLSVWRQDAVMPQWMSDACFLSRDVVGLKHAAEQLRGVARRIPTLAPAADLAWAAYLSVSGRRAEAIALYRRVLGDGSERVYPRWGLRIAQLAETLNEEGQHAEAEALCVRALNTLGGPDARFLLPKHALERQLALAECKQGRTDHAEARLARLQQASEDLDNPLVLALLHRDRARVAAHRRDRASFEAHIVAMEGWANRCRNPALLGQVAQQRMDPGHRFPESTVQLIDSESFVTERKAVGEVPRG